MVPLLDIGFLQYGTFRFDVLYQSSMSGQVEWDRAKRAVKYVTWKLQVDGIVTDGISGGPIDAVFLNMRRQLTKPGQQLTYKGRGFGGQGQGATGGLVVNGPGKVQDVAWGPKPSLLNFKPLGNSCSAMVSWQVEFTIPECATANFTNTMLSFNWNGTLAYDSDSMCTYSVDGEFEIALNYGADDKVDNYRALSEPALPVGFRCMSRNFGYSDDKRNYAFSYVFQEMPVQGMPIGCTNATGHYSVKSDGSYRTTTGIWNANLSATYTIRPDFPRREAWLRFVGMWNTKLLALGYTRMGVVGAPLPVLGNSPPTREYAPGLQTTVFANLPPNARRYSALNLISGDEYNQMMVRSTPKWQGFPSRVSDSTREYISIAKL